MNLKKAAILIIDVILLIALVTTGLVFGYKQNTEYGFDVELNQRKENLKSGETVTIDMNVTNIDVGEKGINVLLGSLEFDGNLFDEVNIIANKKLENLKIQTLQNTKSDYDFCIYVMGEGLTEDQNIATISMKVKENISRQQTEVKVTNIKTSNGDSSIELGDRIVKLNLAGYKGNTNSNNQEYSALKIALVMLTLIVAIINIHVFINPKMLRLISTILLVVAAVIVLIGFKQEVLYSNNSDIKVQKLENIDRKDSEKYNVVELTNVIRYISGTADGEDLIKNLSDINSDGKVDQKDVANC